MFYRIFYPGLPAGTSRKVWEEHELPLFSKSRAEKHHQGVAERAVRLHASWQHYLKPRGEKNKTKVMQRYLRHGAGSHALWRSMRGDTRAEQNRRGECAARGVCTAHPTWRMSVYTAQEKWRWAFYHVHHLAWAVHTLRWEGMCLITVR